VKLRRILEIWDRVRSHIDYGRFFSWFGLSVIALLPLLASAAKIRISRSSDYSLLWVDASFAFYFVMISFTTVVDALLAARRQAGPIPAGGTSPYLERGTELTLLMIIIVVVLVVLGAYGLVLYSVSAFSTMHPTLVPIAKSFSKWGVIGIVPLSLATQFSISRQR
jgi:hypothetical protein